MNVTAVNSEPNNVQKKVFTLKPVQKNGLILQIHHTNSQYSTAQKKNLPLRIRFINTSFDISGKISATSDLRGNIFIIDFAQIKYWLLPNLETCSVLKFSSLNSNDLLIGRQNGQILILNIHDGVVHTVWEDHKHPVRNISFAHEKCLTASSKEAIIYNLRSFQILHALSLKDYAKLSYVIFTPVYNYILTCFADSYINVWESKHFRSIRQILPTTWKKRNIRCFAFTRNGQLMVLAGKSNFLLKFSFDSWSLEKTISLPLSLRAVKQIDFIPQDHDGGANRVLAILSSDGILYMYDMDFNFVLSETRLDSEINSFEVSPFGHTIACVLHSGEVNFYKSSLLIKNYFLRAEEDYKTQQKLKLYLPPPKKITDIMDTNKLKSILLEYGEFPVSYRTTIWTKILKLPCNRQCYTSFINRSDEDFFPDLEHEYPMINKRLLKNLKRTLNNIAVWCPFFINVDFLPLFIFPFIKVFENDPIQCFEAAITIIMNWCQHWLENIPAPPLNILAIIENVLFQHDPQLMQHFRLHNVTSFVYGWTLLEVAFSEVLTINEWQNLWDHIICNEPSFLLFAPVAYNLINRTTLLTFTKLEEFEIFYHSQNPITLKRFIWKIYNLNDLTTEDIHPRQYLEDFNPLTKPEYPIYIQYTQNSEIRMSAGEENRIPNRQENELDLNLKVDEEEEFKFVDSNDGSSPFKLASPNELSLSQNERPKSPPKTEIKSNSHSPVKAKKRLSVILAQLDDIDAFAEEDLNNINKKIDENVKKLLAQKEKLQKYINEKPKPAVTTKSQRKITYKTHVSVPSESIKKSIKNRSPNTLPGKKMSRFERITAELEKQVQALLEKQTTEARTQTRDGSIARTQTKHKSKKRKDKKVKDAATY